MGCTTLAAAAYFRLVTASAVRQGFAQECFIIVYHACNYICVVYSCNTCMYNHDGIKDTGPATKNMAAKTIKVVVLNGEFADWCSL